MGQNLEEDFFGGFNVELKVKKNIDRKIMGAIMAIIWSIA